MDMAWLIAPMHNNLWFGQDGDHISTTIMIITLTQSAIILKFNGVKLPKISDFNLVIIGVNHFYSDTGHIYRT